ncbi:hypothetical protein BOTNAR_0073g00110 [Botryotinia narcissicola]|uniref:Uncharacterized protein n=1 Tax=Botryotinia narcissicola TaxID=278944 RepID=A0A4Z1IWZ3_9HELO|nr:hypothetical protein BOTNAR_0073g00110 [Botryotinia narcissicola]
MCLLLRPRRECVCNNDLGDKTIYTVWIPEHNYIETLCREAALGLKEHHSKFWKQKENYRIVELECRKFRLQILRIKSKQAKEAAEEQAREAKVQADRARANASYQANRQNRRVRLYRGLQEVSTVSDIGGNKKYQWRAGGESGHHVGGFSCSHRTLEGTVRFIVLCIVIALSLGMSTISF